MNITAAVKKYTPLRLLASYTPCDLMKKIDSDSTSTSCIDHFPSHSNARRWRERRRSSFCGSVESSSR